MHDDWQPIETAPKDAESLLVATFSGVVGEAWFSTIEAQWRWQSDSLVLGATHWMPLPKPPIGFPVVTEPKENVDLQGENE